jgi:hypothetical protein
MGLDKHLLLSIGKSFVDFKHETRGFIVVKRVAIAYLYSLCPTAGDPRTMLSVFSVDIPENLPSAPDPTTAAALNKGLTIWKRRSNIDHVREKESAELNRRLSELAKVVPKGVDIRNVNFGTGAVKSAGIS